MKSVTMNDTKITFTERPKHKSVMAARNIMTQEIMKMVDIKNVDPSKSISDYLKEQIADDPDIAIKLSNLKSDLEVDQTILLATNLDYTSLQELKEEIYADEFIELFEKSKKALGGKSAEDFFNIYPTSTDLTRNNQVMSL